MANYKKGTPEYKAFNQGKKKKNQPESGLNKLLASGGLGAAGLLISAVMKDGKRKS